MTNPPELTHEEYDELAAGYALHALEPDEELVFTDHLAGCARCAAVLDDHSFVAAQLGSLADTEEVRRPEWTAIRRGIVGDQPAAVVSLDERRRRLNPRLLAAAAGVALLAGAGAVTWQTTNGGGSSVAAAIAACQSQTSCQVVRLHANDADPAVVLVSDGQARVIPVGMKAPAAGQEYVLWQLPRSNGPTAIGEFTDASRGMTTRLLMPYAETAAFAISLEPSNTPPSTPTKVLAVGQTTT
jgi:hypothetical protein